MWIGKPKDYIFVIYSWALGITQVRWKVWTQMEEAPSPSGLRSSIAHHTWVVQTIIGNRVEVSFPQTCFLVVFSLRYIHFQMRAFLGAFPAKNILSFSPSNLILLIHVILLLYNNNSNLCPTPWSITSQVHPRKPLRPNASTCPGVLDINANDCSIEPKWVLTLLMIF